LIDCLDRSEVKCLQRDLAPHGLLLEHLDGRLEPVLRRGADLDQLVVLADARSGVLEVEPLRDLAPGLVDGVRDLGHRDLGDDVEREVLLGHGGHPIVEVRKPHCYPSAYGRMPERPKGAVCKIAG
jgi:hypothetical protein